MNKGKIFFFGIILLLSTSDSSFSQMFWNNAGRFDSVAFLSYQHTSAIDITGSFTFEMWLCPTDTVTPGGAYDKQRQVLWKDRYNITLQHGKPRLFINGNPVLTFKTGLAPNKWNHIAFTKSTSTNTLSAYLNGVLDTSRNSSVVPSSSLEDLYIGSNPLINTMQSNFKGYIDEVRIWNRELSAGEVSTYFRTFLGIRTGIYEGMVFSVGFQANQSVTGTPYPYDMSDNNVNLVVEMALQNMNQESRPQTTVSMNEAIELDGSGDYAAASHVSEFNNTGSQTLEAWIYPRQIKSQQIIYKGPANLSGVKYSMAMTIAGKITGNINNVSVTDTTVIPLNTWTHVVFQYKNAGQYKFFINGRNATSGTMATGQILTSSDSLYIGGTGLGGHFNGFIDEPRVEGFIKSEFDIQKEMYISKDRGNERVSNNDVAYNLDGLQYPSTTDGSLLRFRNNARFSHPAAISNQPVSPMLRLDDQDFMKGFYMKQSDRLIPASGTSGLMTEDSLYIDLDVSMNDVNFFVAANHTFSNDLEITIVSPQYYEAYVCFDAGQLGANDNIITVFDDQADTALVNGTYIDFGPVIKGQVELNKIFSANSSKGLWRMRINDDNSGNTGRLYAWGVQINNMSSKISTLSTNCLIQGMYDPATNNMTRDTMRIYLRNAVSPYTVKDSDKVYLGILGGATAEFNNTDTGKYYLQFKHRNALETWSAVTIGFDAFTQQYTYEFKADVSKAYGNNMIQVDNAPVRYAFFSGDVNQDETIDATDLSLIDNDAINFVGGYVSTDLTGDSFVDATDYSIADNNAYNFVSLIRP